MTVKADVTSTLNGQSADLVLIEDGDSRNYETKALSGGTETLIFTGLDGGRDKEYTAKIVPSTSDVTQTAEVDFGAEIEIDPIPHRDAGADNQVRETAEFKNGVSANEIGLGDNALVGGLLTTALNDGEVLADDGYVYSSIQAAQDAASSWIFIGPGTFNESVTIDTDGLTFRGSGHDTIIDGGSLSPGDVVVNIEASNVTISSLQISGSGGNGRGINMGTQNSNILAENVFIDANINDGIALANGSDNKIINCTVKNVADAGMFVEERGVISQCYAENCGGASYATFGSSGNDDVIISNNIAVNSGFNSINLNGDDSIIIGNRVINSGNDGISLNTNDCIIANNRVSDSSGSNINNAGSGTVLDGNNTGASN